LTQSEPRAGAQRTVLVVDDEDIVRALVVRSLGDAGYHVLQASQGAAAIGLLEHEAAGVDLVICDLVMPTVGGREVAGWMKEHCPAVRLLFISGYPRTYLQAHELFDPSVPLLRKPFLPSRLLEHVEELVGGAGGRTACQGEGGSAGQISQLDITTP
jgi:CheY-like chemotaxis protein